MKIIFLDIDGVLNSEAYFERIGDPAPPARRDWIDPHALRVLHQIARGFDVGVVLSTSWVLQHGAQQTTRWLIDAGLTLPVLGETPRETFSHREKEIINALRQGFTPACDGIVILEDAVPMPRLTRWIARTTWEEGLRDAHVHQARAILGNEPPPFARAK